MALLSFTRFARSGSQQKLPAGLAETLLAACDTPAALADGDGVIVQANADWAKLFARRGLDAGLGALAGPEAAYAVARAIHAATPLELAAGDRQVTVSPCPPWSLVRLKDTRSEAAVRPSAPQTKPAAKSAQRAPAPAPPAEPVREVEGIASSITLEAGRRAALIDAAPIGIATLDTPDLTRAVLVSANRAFVVACGGGQGSRFADLIGADDQAGLAALQPGTSAPVELQLAVDPQRLVECWLIDDGTSGASLMVQDVTAKRQMETSLTQNSKLEVLGQLAARVAHDLNNNFTVIGNAKDLLLRRHPLGDPSYPALMEIDSVVAKGAEMILQLLNYSRGQTVRRAVTDITAVIADFQSFVHRLVDSHADMEVRQARNVPEVLVDQQQLEGLFMNLATNARDAIRAKGDGRGRITIETRPGTSDQLRAALTGTGATAIPDCAWAVFSITDTGTGIPEDIRDQIFNPFFTTKPRGEGTGIGMGSIYGIVKKANGYITLDTEVGRGTTFTVWLPEAVSQASPEELAQMRQPEARTGSGATPTQQSHLPVAADLTGRGRILLAEDEDGLRRMVAMQFEELGYEVVTAGDGEEALELLMAEPGNFEFILTDVKMPLMDGPSFLRNGKPFLGNAKVVIMTGYAEADLSELLESEQAVALVTKPYRFADLAERVKQMQAL
ncbi:MAG: ATP-binding protein [Hyphomonadaceae bacterium]|nr:ATP-binding protein [Hyphomonadaceae bacterium]